MANENLGNAKKAKNDEFYTQYHDIEKEINAYLEYNPDVFKGKTVLLPCDDPEWSNFTKFFAQKFQDLGLKKLISTSYAPNSKPPEIPYQPTLFEMENEKFDEVKTQDNGKIFTLTKDKTGDGVINVEDLEWTYLEGDGDFRSEEIMKLRDEADVIITNPPFSLFREFLSWVVQANKMFVLLGNLNAITYKETFPLIKDNKMWLGATIHSGDREFRIPTGSVTRSASKRVDKDGNTFLRVPGVRWFSNIDHGRRHEPIVLMTERENIKFSRHEGIKDVGYQKYDNYDAIEVPRTEAIPSDYKGVMGVPISFLSKYNPDQFEILGTSDNGLVDDSIKSTPGLREKFVHDYYQAGGKGAYKAGNPTAGIYIDGLATMVYKRIFIRHKKANQ
jgi:hypothetical protein